MYRQIVLALATLSSSVVFAQTRPRPANATWCQAFKSEFDRDPSTPGTNPRFAILRQLGKVTKVTGSRLPPPLKPHEQFMIQLAVLYSGSTVLTPQQSIEAFFDLKSPTGTNDGSIISYEVTNTATSKRQEVAIVTYFPGDNQYGVLYRITRPTTAPAKPAPALIGSIADGELYCHDLPQ